MLCCIFTLHHLEFAEVIVASFLKPSTNNMILCNTIIVINNAIEAIVKTNFQKMDGV
jgi:hypothetical protein